MAYPYLPFEPERVRRLRCELQKPYDKEEFLAWLIYRRVSIYLTLCLSRTTNVLPNHVTLFGIMLGTLASTIALTPSPRTSSLAFVLLHLSYFCDLIDGELARLRRVFSPVGPWLDELLAATIASTVALLGAGALQSRGLVMLSAFWITLNVLRHASSRALLYLSSARRLPTTAFRQRHFLFNLLAFGASPLGFSCFLLLSQTTSSQIFLALGYSLFIAASLAQLRLIYRFFLTAN